MKSIGALASAVLVCACSPVQPNPPFVPPPDREDSQDVLVGPARWKEYRETDALRYEIDLQIDPERHFLQGEIRYTFRALRTLTEIRLDSVYGGEWSIRFFQSRELTTRQLGDRITIRLDDEVAAGSEFTFRAELLGTPPDGLFFTENRYGRPCAFTDHFAARARGWLPSEDHPGDRAHFKLRLAIPPGYDAVCTGAIRPTRDASRSDWLPEGMAGWEGETVAELPTYLLAFAVAPYARIAERGDSRIIPHFIYEEDVELARASLTHHAAWMRRMEETFGTYPYAKYCVAQIPTRWGAMENAGNTWVSESLFDQDDGGVGTLAHEFAHQWFGDGVGYDDWYEVWLSEGFASYLGPWLHEGTGGPTLADSMAEARERWLGSPEGRTQAIRWLGYPNPDDALNANTYPKAAWVLHMLRAELGDEVFFRGVRNYYGSHRGSTARTADFRESMEKTSHRELAWFFEQWLDRPDCPELDFVWTDQGVIVTQVQHAAPFQFLLQLRWTAEDAWIHDESFRITERSTILKLDGAPISHPKIDPYVELLFRPAG